MVTAAILGCAGYTGQETLDRLLAHPGIEPVVLGSDSQAGTAPRAFDPVSEFRAGGAPIALRGQLLEHSFAPEIVDKCTFPGGEMPPHDCQILPLRRMCDKLPNQRVPIPVGGGKEQHPGGKPVDAMYDKHSPPDRFQ